MPLFFFPRRPAAAAIAVRPRFRLQDEVRVAGDARVHVVIGFRAARPHLPELLIAAADGATYWVAERCVRAAKARLEVIAGGRS